MLVEAVKRMQIGNLTRLLSRESESASVPQTRSMEHYATPDFFMLRELFHRVLSQHGTAGPEAGESGAMTRR